MDITWHGHSAFSIKFGEIKILVDPFLRYNPAFDDKNFERVTEGATHILLTHGHFDHVGDTVEIGKASGAQIVCNYDLYKWLETKGLENFNPAGTGGTVDCGGFTTTLVNALHLSAYLDDQGVSHSLGNPNGLVLHIDGEKTIYHMGDTDIFGDMALIEELHQPQVAMVPIGDRFTMGGAVAALACQRYFNFEAIFPCHYGSFPIIAKDADLFIQAMGTMGDKVVRASVGEAISM